MVSNYIGNDLSSKAGHRSKQEGSFINIERPTMVIKYNSHMDGVHMYNMLISLFQIWHQSTKYFMYIILHWSGCRQLFDNNMSFSSHGNMILSFALLKCLFHTQSD